MEETKSPIFLSLFFFLNAYIARMNVNQRVYVFRGKNEVGSSIALLAFEE